MLRLSLTTALAFAFAVTTTGCFEQLVGPYDGPLLVEFAQVDGGYEAAVPEGAGTVTLDVNLIGPQQSSAVTVAVATTGSTATEGTHFSFPNGASVTIPANSSTGEFSINIPDGGLAAGASVDLVLELTQSSDGSVEGSDNLDDFTLTIVGV